MKTPWSESRMRETRTSGLMTGGVETGPLQDTAPPLDSTRFLLNGYNWLDNKELWSSAKYGLFLRWCSAETSKRQAREAVLWLRSAWSRAQARSRRGSRSALPRIASRICETSGLGHFLTVDQLFHPQGDLDYSPVQIHGACGMRTSSSMRVTSGLSAWWISSSWPLVIRRRISRLFCTWDVSFSVTCYLLTGESPEMELA